MRVVLLMVLALMLANCGPASVPPTLPAPDPQKPDHSLLEIGQGKADNQTVTLQAPLIQRGAQGRVLIPAIALGDVPQPLVSDPQEIVIVGGDPLSGLLKASNGEEYGVVRVTGVVQLQADGVRQIQPTSSKIIQPLTLSLGDVQANNAVYQQQVIAVAGTLIVKPDEALLVEAVNDGGIPQENAAQLKIVQPFNDTALIAALGNSNGTIRYGNVALVGELRGKTFQIFWGTTK